MKKRGSIEQNHQLSSKGAARFRQIMTATKLRHATSVRTFADKLNADYGFRVTSHAAFSRLENFGLGASILHLEEARLAYIAPYTYCEVLKRPYSVQELVAIAQGELDPDQWDNQVRVSVTSANNLEELTGSEAVQQQLSSKKKEVQMSSNWGDQSGLQQFALLIRRWMEQAGWTEERLAEESRIELETLRAILDGRREISEIEFFRITGRIRKPDGTMWDTEDLIDILRGKSSVPKMEGEEQHPTENGHTVNGGV
jgi:hypothetical protein